MKKSRRTSRSSVRKTESRKPTEKSSVPYVFGAIAAAVVVALIIILIIVFAQQRDGVLAVVNGQDIAETELDFQYNLLPDEYKASFDKEAVLEQIIDETLVVQAAERQGIGATEEEVLQRVQAILATNEMSITELQENLAQFNVSQEQFEALIKRQIIIERYLNQTLQYAEADETTLRALYDTSLSQHAIPEQVSVQHVLISNQRTDAALIAKEVYDAARNGADFCTLAAENSDDRGSRETCGAYTFPTGFMDPVFEQAAFTMEDGEIRLIQTQFGYHVIKRLNLTPAGTRPYDEVRPELVAQFNSAERSLQYRRLISTLRSTATIVYANGTRIVPQQPAAIAPVEPTGPATEPMPTEPVEQVAPIEPVEPTPVEPTEPVPSEPVDVPAVPEPSSGDLFSCIAARSTLYGTSWSTDTQTARQTFERQGVSLNYVECNTGGSCSGITAYPTWVINGEQYLGRMSIEQLKNAADC